MLQLPLEPFGFIFGPAMAQCENRKAALRHPVEDRRPQTRGKGFAWRQWRVMTVLTLMGAFGAMAIISGLPTFLFVLYAQLSQ
ncbi:hypothetical protein [Stenotrophomonas maltophilia]|uniref:hypothetical protein n=1 Tax=Stenotrophomonas maltophilia TaxID=40324 RepID=UPI001D11DF60|nr:hypothetical protein [Stenotrophomonas maltophilia]UXB37573.1 hypothetical protein K7563_07325 [Stenotrophomonas maltophilia]